MGNAVVCGRCSNNEIMRTELSIPNNEQPIEEFENPGKGNKLSINRNEQYIHNNEKNIEDNKNSKNDKYENEIYTGHKYIPLKISEKVKKSICKITIKNEGNISNGTGFFMKISESLKFLFTNHHVINQHLINDNIEIEIWNNEKMNLNLNEYKNKYYENKHKDFTIIEIKKEDKIYKDIIFLDYDLNYLEKGFSIYKNVDVFALGHPLGGDVSCASGRILNIDNYKFTHDLSTDTGSSGSPIILLNNNINSIQVIGIHKTSNISISKNCGIFIGEIINELKNDSNFFSKIKKIEKIKE